MRCPNYNGAECPGYCGVDMMGAETACEERERRLLRWLPPCAAAMLVLVLALAALSWL